MPDDLTTITEFTEPHAYQIRIQGCLTADWADWFDSLNITPSERGETLLTTSAMDQAALYGLLKKVRDLGLTLVSVNPIIQTQKE
jgi:hypothetical protein